MIKEKLDLFIKNECLTFEWIPDEAIDQVLKDFEIDDDQYHEVWLCILKNKYNHVLDLTCAIIDPDREDALNEQYKLAKKYYISSRHPCTDISISCH